MRFYLYIARSKDNSLYTGITRNVQRRIFEHNTDNRNGAKSLRGKRPIVLVYKEEFDTISEALKREKEIKGWSRDKKLKLINALAQRSEATMRV